MLGVHHSAVGCNGEWYNESLCHSIGGLLALVGIKLVMNVVGWVPVIKVVNVLLRKVVRITSPVSGATLRPEGGTPSLDIGCWIVLLRGLSFVYICVRGSAPSNTVRVGVLDLFEVKAILQNVRVRSFYWLLGGLGWFLDNCGACEHHMRHNL